MWSAQPWRPQCREDGVALQLCDRGMEGGGGKQGYAYSYSGSPDCPGGASSSGGVVLQLRCPAFSSFSWLVRLYSLVLAGLGACLAAAWVAFHL